VAPQIATADPSLLPDQPTAVETAGAPLEQKINDPDYRSRYYNKPGMNGVITRKNVGTLDADSDVVPPISADPADLGRYRITPDGPDVAARFVDRRVVDGSPADTEMQKLVDERAQAIASGDPARITTAGEAFGEAAGRASVYRDFPADRYEVQELTDSKNKKPGITGQFDQVWRVVPKDGGPEQVIVIEAKSPYATLGARRGSDGKLYQQGTLGYLRSIVATPASNASRPAVDAVRGALSEGRLTYRLVQARPPSDGAWSGYVVRDFDLTAAR
jgi:hypothetical protein